MHQEQQTSKLLIKYNFNKKSIIFQVIYEIRGNFLLFKII